jgi:hypothetical protein
MKVIGYLTKLALLCPNKGATWIMSGSFSSLSVISITTAARFVLVAIRQIQTQEKIHTRISLHSLTTMRNQKTVPVLDVAAMEMRLTVIT